MESNNVVEFDFRKKPTPEEKARDVLNNVIIPAATKDEYKKFVTNPDNINKIQSIMGDLMKQVSLYYPEIINVRFGDALFLKEGLISLLMRSQLNQEHPFQKMADGLEKAYNELENDSTK